MEQNKNKNKWIEEILSSSDGIKRAEAGPYIYSKILHRLKSNKNGSNVIPVRKAAIGFITVLLLAVLNVMVVFNSGSSQNKLKTNVDQNESSTEFIPSQYNPYLEILNNN